MYGIQIKHLDLSENNMGNKGVKYLAEYLDCNPTLEYLSLSQNGISTKGALRVINLFEKCPKLNSINFSGNEKIHDIAIECEKK